MSTPRHAPPFFCPYCGEEDIRPYGEEVAGYRCGSCLRVWTLRLQGTTTASTENPSTENSSTENSSTENASAETTSTSTAPNSISGITSKEAS